jgi:hypothetical protein
MGAPADADRNHFKIGAAYNRHFLRIYFSALAEFNHNAQITILPLVPYNGRIYLEEP